MKSKNFISYLSFIILFLFTTKVNAQLTDNLYVGIMGGGTFYYGDLPRSVNGGIAVNLSKENIHKTFAVRIQLSYGQLSSNYNNSANGITANFKSQFLEAGLLPEFSLFDLEHSKITPYIAAGIAAARYFHRSGSYNGTPTTPQQFTFNVPFGGGVKYILNEDIFVKLEYLQRITFSNNIDGINTGNGYDFWGQGMIGISFRLHSILHYRKDRQGRFE